MKKKILVIVFFIAYGLIWQFYELINYGLMQAKGQLEVVYNSIPIDEVLSNPNTSQKTRDKINLMQEIRRFAIDSIGLNNSNNYCTYYEQNDKEILWNLSACSPFEFKSKEWSFPILGSFSYKGFFDLDAAKLEQVVLDSMGFDTRIRTVSAWSTLGWFNDPILSNMLKRNEGSLAELIIHELTHSTIFVKDSLTYNENLASFIGEQGAQKFLTSKYGIDSEEYKVYNYSEADYIKYFHHMLFGYQKLDSLYKSFKNETKELKLKKKEHLIQQIVNNIDTIAFDNKKRFSGIFDKKLPNNASFQSYERYTSKLDEFEQIMLNEYQGDIVKYVSAMKEKWQ